MRWKLNLFKINEREFDVFFRINFFKSKHSINRVYIKVYKLYFKTSNQDGKPISQKKLTKNKDSYFYINMHSVWRNSMVCSMEHLLFTV